MNSCLPLVGKLLLKNFQNGFAKNLLVSPLSLNATATMIGAGCSGRTLGRVLNFVGCNNLDDLKSGFSDTMSRIATSTSCSEDSPKKISFAKGARVDKHFALKPYDYQQYVNYNECSPKISFANGVWVDKRFPLKHSYQQCVRDVFKSEAKNVDFSNQADEVVKEINSWAEFQTNGIIKSVIQPQNIDSVTALVLGNVLYFKGYWLDEFNPQWTKKRDFYLLNGDKISVPFMTSSSSYLYGSFDDFKVLEIPYQRGREDKKQFSMQILLPNEKDSLQNLLEKYNADSSGLLNKLNFNLYTAKFKDFWIPKFKFSCSLDNIKFPFMEDEMELTEMVHHVESGGYPFISNIIQKAFIEVDEQGTEAAAFTFTVVDRRALGHERRFECFVADHPFMLIIKEKISGLILFVGAVLNPLLD